MHDQQQITGLVDHLFRSSAGQMVSYLTRVLGPAHMDLAEEAVQDALVKAMQTWPFGGAPQNPALRSPAILSRLTRSALERVNIAGNGRAIDAGELKTNGAIFASVIAATLLFTVFGPEALRRGLNIITTPWSAAAPASMFSIAVDPGNVTIAKGGDDGITGWEELLVHEFLHGCLQMDEGRADECFVEAATPL